MTSHRKEAQSPQLLTPASSTARGRPYLLSLILASRNDEYMGNSRWRLETSLNYIAARVHEMGRATDVQVLVVDWGSETPLSEVVQLTPAAASLSSFMLVPPSIARELQKDSPFPEMLALNAAARRADGQYIGRIDQDTLVGERFLSAFFEISDGALQLGIPPEVALFFSGRRSVPYRFAVRCPPLATVDRFLRLCGKALRVERGPAWAPFYVSSVGIWLMHRNLWNESGGYDEEMIYMGGESNVVARLMYKYKLVDLGALVDHDFYHLEHHHPWALRACWAHRRGNSDFYRTEARIRILNPNGEGWGLATYSFPVSPAVTRSPATTPPLPTRPTTRPVLPFVLCVGAQVILEGLVLALRAVSKRIASWVHLWMHRFKVGRETVRGRPLRTWPQALKRRWVVRDLGSMVFPTNFHTVETQNRHRRP